MSWRLRFAVVSLLSSSLAALTIWRYYWDRRPLIYPDSYQYLLMARGLAEHVRPLLHLGPRGDVFLPNALSALKPLYPALISLVHLFGADFEQSARLVSAASAAAVLVLLGLVCWSWSRSALAAFAPLLLLASPTWRYWSSFSLADQLGVALALAAVLAVSHRRYFLSGVLTALAVSARPELLLVALALGICVFFDSQRAAASRTAVCRVALGCSVALILILLSLRPPLTWVPEMAWSPLFVLVLGALLWLVLHPSRRLAICALVGFWGLFFLCAGLRWFPALREISGREWPLLAFAGAGTSLGVWKDDKTRTQVLRLLTIILALAAAYWPHNHQSTRYLAILLPVFVLVSVLGWTRLGRFAIPAAATVLFVLAVSPSLPSPGPDYFSSAASHLSGLPRGKPLVTVSPDAYGYLLCPRSVRLMRVGVRGLIVLDPAQRTLRPDLTARGRLVASYPITNGFADPRGRVSYGSIRVVDGIVVRVDKKG